VLNALAGSSECTEVFVPDGFAHCSGELCEAETQTPCSFVLSCFCGGEMNSICLVLVWREEVDLLRKRV